MKRNLGAALVACMVLLPAVAVGGPTDFVTTLSVAQMVDPASSLYLYEYTLTNLASSDLSATSLTLSVPVNADLQSLSGPPGWDIIYDLGETSVVWESSGLLSDLLPGSSGLFAFKSSLGLVQQDFTITGLDSTGQDFATNEGRIVAAGANAVPEPTWMTLLGSGALSLLGYSWWRHE